MSIARDRFLFPSLLVLLGACQDQVTDTGQSVSAAKGGAPGAVASVVVSPTTLLLRAGWTEQLSAKAYDASGAELADASFKWKIDAGGIAEVSKAGVVTALLPGTLTISAQSDGPNPVRGSAMLAVISDDSPLMAGGVGGYQGHACALGATGIPTCWGSNQWGQLGIGTGEPLSVSIPGQTAGGIVLRSLTGGAFQSCGLSTAGAAYCWGSNASGELGIGATSYAEYAPQPVAGGLVFASLAVNSRGSHNCALIASGEAYCWGYNGRGFLGDNTTDNRTSPTPVQQGALRFVSLAVGGTHSCGLTAEGRAHCWGGNDRGQLGIGPGPETGNFLTPQAVGQGVLRFASITLGLQHTCGLTTTGAAYCWGYVHGYDTTLPQQVPGNRAYLGLASADLHVCAIDFVFEAYCFGTNYGGRLGDGTFTDATSPIKVAGGLRFDIIRPGGGSTCARGLDTLIYCWGENPDGQLGDGTFTPHIVPAQTLPINP